MLEKLKKYERIFLSTFNIAYRRYLFARIDFNDRFIAIFGPRGVGKTTMLLQYLQDLKKLKKNALYITLDYPFLVNFDLFDFCEEFVEHGGEYLLIDEVHRYKDFAVHLKSVYDVFKNLKIIITGSCATSILSAKADLSRRVTLYHLNGFSLREFLEVHYHLNLQRYTLENILQNHIDICKNIIQQIDIQTVWKNYLEFGYYPFFFDKRTNFLQNLLETINLTLDIDLVSLGLIEQKYTYKLKKLLEVICASEPFEVNYTRIAAAAEISRAKLYDYINYLKNGELINLLEEDTRGIKKIAKPAKIFLNNTNLLYAFCDEQKIGTVRETFFVNQVQEMYDLSRLQKVETRKLQLAGTGERLMISNGYNRYNARFAVRLSPHGRIYFLQATLSHGDCSRTDEMITKVHGFSKED